MTPTDVLHIAVAQLKPVLGDVSGNRDKALAARREAASQGADLVLTTELFLSGYLPEDLVLKPAYQDACRAACEELARATADGGPAMLVGLPWAENGRLHNAVALVDGGEIAAVRFKVELPNYGVFDEKRVFQPGPMPGPIAFRGVRLGVPICEDIWGPDVVECLVETGAEILLVPNGSPYHRDKADARLSIAVARVTEAGLPLLYANEVGGQDEVVFDGASFALNADRSSLCSCPTSRRRWSPRPGAAARRVGPATGASIAAIEEGDAADYRACVLGLRDYVEKNRFPGVRARAVRRGQFGPRRGDGGRRARPGARPLHHDALPLYLPRIPVRCRRLRRGARRAL